MFSNEDGTKPVSNPNATSRASSHQPAWTAKRCSRLLRPLASRLSLLRRRQEQSIARQTQPKRVSTSSGAIPAATLPKTPEQQKNSCSTVSDVSNAQLNFFRSADQDVAADPDWVPVQERMKLKRKYSAFAGNRGGAGHSTTSNKRNIASIEMLRQARPRCVLKGARAPGEIIVPTPIIARSAKIVVGSVDKQINELRQRHDSEIEHESLREGPEKTTTGDVKESSPRRLKRQRQKGLLQSRLAQKLKSPKATSCSGLYNLIEGLFQALENLLQATTSQKPHKGSTDYSILANRAQSEKGSRSLLATCVRLVPDYIALEEKWHCDEDDSGDEIDVTAEVYTELEALGSCEGQGWPYLRETVRSHGINLLHGAVRDSVISCLIPDRSTLNLFFESLISICSANEADAEAEVLLRAIFEVQNPSYLEVKDSVLGVSGHDFIQLPNSIGESLFETPINGILPIVRSWTARTDRPYILYDMLIKMLNSNRLPVAWIATQSFMDEIWPTVIKSLSDIDHNFVRAVSLLEISIIRCCGNAAEDFYTGEKTEPEKSSEHVQRSTAVTKNHHQGPFGIASEYYEDALSNTIFSLCTVMSSVILASVSKISHQAERGSPNFLRAMGYASTEFFRQLSQQQHMERQYLTNKIYLPRITTMATANIIIAAELSDYLPNLKDLLVVTEEYLYHNSIILHGSKYNSDLPDGSNNIIYAIASCCARAAGSGGFEHLRSIITAVLKFTRTISSLRYTTWYMKKLCLEAAIAFAENSENASHAAYAHEIERSLGTLESVRSRKPPVGVKASSDGNSNYGIQSKSEVTPSRPNLVSQTPSQQRSSMRGFRWEEGICEWIAATPASMFLPKRSIPNHDHNLSRKTTRDAEQRSNPIDAPDCLELQTRNLSAINEITPKRELNPSLLPSSPSSLLPNNGQVKNQSRNTATCYPTFSVPTRLGPRLVLSSVDVNVNVERQQTDNHHHRKMVDLAEEPQKLLQSKQRQRQQHWNGNISRNEDHYTDNRKCSTVFPQRRRHSLRQQQQQKRDSGFAFKKKSDCNNNNNDNVSDSDMSDYKHDEGDDGDELRTFEIDPPAATVVSNLSNLETNVIKSTGKRDRGVMRMKKTKMKKNRSALRRNIPRQARQIHRLRYAQSFGL